MKYLIVIIATLLLTGINIWRPDVQPIQVILEAHDVNVVVDTEVRVNIPMEYDLYVVTTLYGYNTTAGTTAHASDTITKIEVKDITNTVVIDTILINRNDRDGQVTGLSYEVDGGSEIAFKVIDDITTPAKGCRVVMVLTDINSVR